MTMGNKLRRVFLPTEEERKEAIERIRIIHEALSRERGCSTCKHCIHKVNYPGVVTAEECECDAGLKCDTVEFTIKNCVSWEDSYIRE